MNPLKSILPYVSRLAQTASDTIPITATQPPISTHPPRDHLAGRGMSRYTPLHIHELLEAVPEASECKILRDNRTIGSKHAPRLPDLPYRGMSRYTPLHIHEAPGKRPDTA